MKHDALQCGFCTPGMVMACKALLDKNKSPTLIQIKKGLSRQHLPLRDLQQHLRGGADGRQEPRLGDDHADKIKTKVGFRAAGSRRRKEIEVTIPDGRAARPGASTPS